jgi:hypothetical protein
MTATAPALKPPHITHLVVVNEDDQAVVVMCLRLKPRAINPDTNLWTDLAPSCAVCHRKWAEQQADKRIDAEADKIDAAYEQYREVL